MRIGRHVRQFTSAAVVLWISIQSNMALALGYLIEQNTQYSSYGCEMYASSDLSDDTASLQTALDNAGWVGQRYVDASAWPQDLWESCSTSIYGNDRGWVGYNSVVGGLDNYYGDVRNLVVFSGHGTNSLLIWGHPHNNMCKGDLGFHIRLGEMGGGAATAAIWYACDVLQPSELGTNMWQSVRQQFGFHDTYVNGPDVIRDFFNMTSTVSNADAWFTQYAAKPAVVESFSRTSADDCWNTQNTAKFKADVGNTPLGGGASCGQPQTWYVGCAEWL